MLLTITTTHSPATDLGYLLAKNPARVQSFDLSFGKAHVYYPEATAARCTAALLLDVDPVGLVKRARLRKGEPGLLGQYVNDRPYVASSFLSVAIGQVLGSALHGRSKERPELAETAIPLEAGLPVLPARGGVGLVRALFEPLGYTVSVTEAAPYASVTLSAERRLSELLSHLYVLVPVLDDDKHYWVGDDEIDKLLAKGGEWLKAHPLRETITHRYLRRQRRLTREALARLTVDEDPDVDASEEREAVEEERLESPLRLDEQRLGAVLAVLRAAGAKRVIDLGCGEGKLVRALLADRAFERVVGVDVSVRSLERAAQRLRLDEMPDRRRERVALLSGSLTYRDERFAGFDAACLVEVIEHVDPSRLAAFERVVFEHARPPLVVLTTPNVEHNVRFERLAAGAFRHRDHRFEWTRAELRAWAEGVAARRGYAVRYLPVGPDDPEVGPPTQMAIFEEQAS
ncbi:MAG: 3' terminal RNA ribose 2'-O-methyltransferase Hen1 [Myxococcales bacterium]|nr:3' terminal RNA ribose 2'-O-methyltransferase Hen1 [Myxococcales bacterium]